MAAAASRPAELRWRQRAARFAPLREGGPGRLPGLILTALLLLGLLRWGQGRIAAAGIDGAGPAAVLLSVLGLGTLALWLLVKAVLRPVEAELRLDDKGVRLIVPEAQRRLDARMQFWAQLAFLISWKGGQWGRYEPVLRWSELREIRHWPKRREYLLRGGAWDIRLICPPELAEAVAMRLRDAAPGLQPSGHGS